MTPSTCRTRGQLHICIRKASGQIEQYTVKNLLVASGCAWIAERMLGNTIDPVSHMAVGTGTTPAHTADAALQNEIARVPITAVRDGHKITYSAIFVEGVATGAIAEAGLFTAGSGGTMTCRSVFGVKHKDPDDVITITWDNLIEAAS